MAKRTSWDQKNKSIHKSRKKIIDTVFGREDNTQHTFGYEGEAEQKHDVGDIWTDKMERLGNKEMDIKYQLLNLMNFVNI